MTSEFCTEHFYVRETLKDVRKEQFRFKKDLFQIKFVLLVVLINTFGLTDMFFKMIGGIF